MTPREKRTRALIARVEKIKARLAKDRDDLRAAFDELEEIASDADMAHDEIAQALRLMESAADAMSKYI